MICKKITGHAVKILPHSVKKGSSKSGGSVKKLPPKYVLRRLSRRFLRKGGVWREAGSIFALRPLFSPNIKNCRTENRLKNKEVPHRYASLSIMSKVDDGEALEREDHLKGET